MISIKGARAILVFQGMKVFLYSLPAKELTMNNFFIFSSQSTEQNLPITLFAGYSTKLCFLTFSSPLNYTRQ